MIRFAKLAAKSAIVLSTVMATSAYAAAPGVVTAAVWSTCCALGVCCGMSCC